MSKSKIRRRIVRTALLVMLLVVFVFFLGVHFVAPYAIIQPPRMNESITPVDLGLAFEKISIVGEGEVVLRGYQIESQRDSTLAIMILIHGVGGCKEHFLPLAGSLSKMGIASIVLDVRAHGESDGEYCTYGYYEKKDVGCMVDYIKSKYPNKQIGIWGNSMGGAIALQAMAYDERINFGVIESTFTSLRQIVYDYQKRLSKGLGLRLVTDYALDRAGKIANFNPDMVSPLVSVRQIEQPVFLAHGDLDENISIDYGKLLFESLSSEQKEFYEVIGGGHFGLFEVGGELYRTSLMRFINLQVNK